ncbi:hypothetical protein M0805_006422 [Coniferiporia weirii]|nr:hypothetical protein M0805_006422 [Coniferiporia weirii]
MEGFGPSDPHGGHGHLRASHTSHAFANAQDNLQDYYDFYWASLHLKTELMHCRSKFRPIGSCAPIIVVVKYTIMHLAILRTAFGINALALFPDDVPLLETLRADVPKARSSLYLKDIATTMTLLSDDLISLDRAFHNYGDIFTDEKLATIIDLLTDDLEIGALSTQDDIRKIVPVEEIQLHLHSLLRNLSGRFLDLEFHLKEFVSEGGFSGLSGLPVISSTLQNKDSRYLTMTTIATFFSGVTATMMQMSYQNNTNSIEIATNAFLLSSIVFSVSSAVASLLTMAWNRSVVRRPEKVLPRWADAWLQKWPIFSLLISGLFFSAALCCFVISSSQGLISQVLTYIFVALNGIELAFLAVWLIFEEWRVRHLPGRAGWEMTDGSLSLDIIDGLGAAIRFVFLGDRRAHGHTNTHPEDGNSKFQSWTHLGRKPSDPFGPNEYTHVLPVTYPLPQTSGEAFGPAQIEVPVLPTLPLRHEPLSDNRARFRSKNDRGVYSLPMANPIPDNAGWLRHEPQQPMIATNHARPAANLNHAGRRRIAPQQAPSGYELPGAKPIPDNTGWLRMPRNPHD